MNIFKYEYKVHKLVKLAFHLIFFIAGLILGITISSAKAYTITTYNGTEIDEDFIYDLTLRYNPNFDFSEYPYIIVSYRNDAKHLAIRYFKNLSFRYYKYGSSNYLGIISSPVEIYNIFYSLSNNSFSIANYAGFGFNENFGVFIFGGGSKTINYADSSNSTSYTNFSWDTSFLSSDGTKPTHTYFDVLSFSPNLSYNPNLFEEDSNFKKVCVNPTDTFSITSKQIQGYNENDNSPYYHSFDFMWFPDGVKGISTYQYDTREESHISLFEESENSFSGWWYWLNTKEEIDTYFGRDNPGLQLQIRGYTNKYNYYNYTMYPFEMAFTPDYYYYPVFWFKDLKIDTSISNPDSGSSGGGHSSGSGRHELEYEDEDDISDKICFYIKNEYDVNILNKNSNGDVYGDITVLGDMNFYDQAYYNELNVDKSGLLNKVNTYINYMRDTINFINTNIFNLYTSMPLLVRLFILSLLTIFVIRLILGMVM